MTVSTGSAALAADILKLVSISKLITATRAAAAASGDVAYSGVGFQPRAVICFSVVTAENAAQISLGMSDKDLAEMCISLRADALNWKKNTALFISNETDGTEMQTAVLKTIDSDGFTLTWTKGGGGGADCTLIFLCIGDTGEIA